MKLITPYLALFAATASAIWPLPSSYEHGDKVLWIDQSVKVTYNGAEQVPSCNVLPPREDTTYQYQSQLKSYGHGGNNGNHTGSASQRVVANAIDRKSVV